VISTAMWVLAGVTGWMAAGFLAAVVIGRSIREADEHAQPEWDDACTCGAELTDWDVENTDVLGDVDARFWVIADDLRRTA